MKEIVTIRRAETNVDAAFYNFGRSSIPMYRVPKCRGNGWEIVLENGERLEWMPTKKACQNLAKELNLKVKK